MIYDISKYYSFFVISLQEFRNSFVSVLYVIQKLVYHIIYLKLIRKFGTVFTYQIVTNDILTLFLFFFLQTGLNILIIDCGSADVLCHK